MDKIDETWTARTFRALDSQAKGYLVRDEILSLINNQGVHGHHSIAELIKVLEAKQPDEQITYKEMVELTHGLNFLKRVFEWDLTLPHFDSFR